MGLLAIPASQQSLICKRSFTGKKNYAIPAPVLAFYLFLKIAWLQLQLPVHDAVPSCVVDPNTKKSSDSDTDWDSDTVVG
jgi:hypothetical protein